LAAAMLVALLWSRPWVARVWSAGIAAFTIYGFLRNWS
jgi:hypothetical protein